MHKLTMTFTHLLVLVITGLLHESETASVGFEVIPRFDQLVDLRGTFIFADAMFQDGNLTGFQAYFNDNPQSFKFQIWRPEGIHTTTKSFMLVHEVEIRTASEGIYPSPAINAAFEQVAVKDGDRLGFSYTLTTTCPLATTWGTDPVILYIPVTASGSVGDTITFSDIQYPFEVSLRATYDVDERGTDSGPRIVGHTGATGATGRPGSAGQIGPKGDRGYIGLPGSRGYTGIKGNRGPTGDRGDVGVAGPLGPTGATGARGETGATGSAGVTGVKGERGDKGDLGPIGPSGATGGTGYTGHTGRVGSTGERGATGFLGSTGHRGSTGDRGPAGPIGATGATGWEGERGYTGSTGSRGNIGATGDRGPIYQDVNECDTGNHGCEHQCVNEFGSYRCQCNEGYHLRADKRTCKDMDECREYNGGCQKVCSNLLGTFKCSCPSGLTLSANGRQCQDILECEVNNGGCSIDEKCIDTYGTYHCVLNVLPAYTGRSGVNAAIGSTADLGHVTLSLEDSRLVNRDVITGMIAWLILLSLIVLALLLCACVRKIRENHDGSAYVRAIDNRSRAKDRESMAFTKDQSVFY